MTMDELQRDVRELQRKLRELLSNRQRSNLGTQSAPVEKFFIRDAETGSVASVDYDSDSNALRVKKVR